MFNMQSFLMFVSGDVLNIDPLNFYSQLYRILPKLHAGQNATPSCS